MAPDHWCPRKPSAQLHTGATLPPLFLNRPSSDYHWFEHADQPAEGRFDGENSNFGTVSIDDEVYEELTQTMTSVNAEAEAIHMSAGRTS